MRNLINNEFRVDNIRLSAFNKDLLVTLIFAGVFLSIYQLFYNRSLWLDEAMLGLNIISRNFDGLLSPLDDFQVAPIGFLYIEKIFTLLFGNSGISLRIFPLLSFLISIPLLYFVFKKLTNNKIIAVLSTTFFALNPVLLSYASEVKQYSTDVLFTLIILLIFLNYDFHNRKSLILYGIVGFIAIWFSNISIIFLFVCGMYSIITEYLTNKSIRTIYPIGFWIISFGFYYFFFIKDHPSLDHQLEYWSNSNKYWGTDLGFLPMNPFKKEFYIFLFRIIRILFGKILPFGQSWILSLTISFAGLFFIIRKKEYKFLYIAISPILIHFVLSGFKLYPISNRLILYYSPFLISFFIFGFYSLIIYLKNKIKFSYQYLLLIPILYLFIPISARYPFEKEEINKSIAVMNSNSKASENVYIYYRSIPAFKFYLLTENDSLKNRINYGLFHRENYSLYDSELLSLRDTTWLIFSHVYIGSEGSEEEYMIKFLTDNNYSLAFEKKFTGSSVYKIIEP